MKHTGQREPAPEHRSTKELRVKMEESTVNSTSDTQQARAHHIHTARACRGTFSTGNSINGLLFQAERAEIMLWWQDAVCACVDERVRRKQTEEKDVRLDKFSRSVNPPGIHPFLRHRQKGSVGTGRGDFFQAL
ncbi:hypothetical protein PoB_003265400 [Plakobranchus ocellatus]|uniref:Uncharacterized protein n=1 Tax=Plakobranchus ocellatus TaxID=259542 RepID=A0AAV4AIR9_9GAST|nr:hypothetical protein PoB_003265400 [Plakobranchus ocellatus]